MLPRLGILFRLCRYATASTSQRHSKKGGCRPLDLARRPSLPTTHCLNREVKEVDSKYTFVCWEEREAEETSLSGAPPRNSGCLEVMG